MAKMNKNRAKTINQSVQTKFRPLQSQQSPRRNRTRNQTMVSQGNSFENMQCMHNAHRSDFNSSFPVPVPMISGLNASLEQ